jgi:phytanoyl-CoA dioxygenase PhyH
MNEIEKYQFDLNGFIVVKRLLSREDVKRYLAAAEGLENRVARKLDEPPNYVGHFSIEYHYDKELGCSSYKNDWGGGLQYIVDDFFNASSEFDSLVNHGPTMAYVSEMAMGPFQLVSSELRFRYKGNVTLTHMGGVIDARNRFEFVGRPVFDSATGAKAHRDFNLLTVRIIYALHDVPIENGAFCAVPGSHKANFFSPYGDDPTKEPGMIGIALDAGDVLFFTENLRHGGLPNLSDTPRKTIHLAIGPAWAGSQSPAHWNKNVHVSPEAWMRYSEEQRALFPWSRQALTWQNAVQRLQNEVDVLKRNIDDMQPSGSRQATAPLR